MKGDQVKTTGDSGATINSDILIGDTDSIDLMADNPIEADEIEALMQKVS